MMMQYEMYWWMLMQKIQITQHSRFQLTVCEFVIFELWRDDLQFINPVYQMVLDEFHQEIRKGISLHYKHLYIMPILLLQISSIDIASFSEAVRHKWEKFGVNVPQEIHFIKRNRASVIILKRRG